MEVVAIVISNESSVELARRKTAMWGCNSTSNDVSHAGYLGGNDNLTLLAVGRVTHFESMRRGLEAKGYRIEVSSDDAEVLRSLSEAEPSIILVDLDSGCFDDDRYLLRTIRERYDTPIIGILSVDDLTTVDEGLELEFDDYVSRVVCSAELDLRIRLILAGRGASRQRIAPRDRRVRGDRRRMHRGRRQTERHKALHSQASPRITVGPFEIDDDHKTVSIGGQPCRLSPKEYTLLKLLAEATDRVVSMEEIVASLWPGSTHADINDVQQYVHLLRKKVEVDPKRPLRIKTIKGFGYVLVVDDTA